MKNRLILVTSPLQVLTAKTAIDSLKENNNEFKNHIAIIHPILTQESRRMIKLYSSKLNYDSVIDFSDKILSNMKVDRYKTKKNNFFYKFVNVFNKSKYVDKRYVKNVNLISSTLRKKIGYIDSIFVRSNYKKIDSIFIDIFDNIKLYLFEEGVVDYTEKNWQLKYFHLELINNFNLVIYESISMLKRFFANLILFILLIIKLRNLNLSKKICFVKSYNFEKKFNYFSISNFDQILYRNIKLSSSLKKNYDKKIMIAGTVYKFWDSNSVEEILIYNELIDHLKIKYNIDNSDIIYKPHPRCENLDNKKKYLKCAVLEHNDYMAEEYLLNYNIISIYSFGSSSLIYARRLFDIESNLIYLYRSPYKRTLYRFFNKKFCFNNKINIFKIEYPKNNPELVSI